MVQIGQSDDIDFSSPVPVTPENRDENLYKRWLAGASRAGYYSEPLKLRFKDDNTVINFGLAKDA